MTLFLSALIIPIHIPVLAFISRHYSFSIMYQSHQQDQVNLRAGHSLGSPLIFSYVPPSLYLCSVTVCSMRRCISEWASYLLEINQSPESSDQQKQKQYSTCLCKLTAPPKTHSLGSPEGYTASPQYLLKERIMG